MSVARRKLSTTAIFPGIQSFTGTVQRRSVSFDGHRMTLSPPPSPDPTDGTMSVRRLTWERVSWPSPAVDAREARNHLLTAHHVERLVTRTSDAGMVRQDAYEA